MLNKVIFLISFLSMIASAKGQQLAPSLTKALLKVRVMDLDENPSEGEIITFISKQTDSAYEGITDAAGSFELLIPKGQTYIVNYRNFGYDHQYAEHEIPEYEGRLVSKINIKYRLPSKTVLDNVSFESDHYTLKSSSFESLDKLVQLLKVKKSTNIQISAHCDNQLERNDAIEVTNKQADEIRTYLIEKGIEPNRLSIKGYGPDLPMATNDTLEGRDKNNRIEIEILQ